MRAPVYLALFVALAVAVVVRAGPDEPSKSGSKILIVHMQRVIDETAEGREFVKKLNEEMASEKKRLGEEVAKLQEKVKELAKAQLSDRGTEFYAKYQKAMKTQFDLKTREQVFLLKKQDEISRATNELIRGAQMYAKKIMKERGAEIVFLSKLGPLEVNNDKEFQQELVFRRVLCSRKELDITDEVIARMNEWYEANRRPSGGVKPVREEAGAGAGAAAPAKPAKKGKASGGGG